MILRAIGFVPNGRSDLVGTIVVCSDQGTSLGVERTGNYSRDAYDELARIARRKGLDMEVLDAKFWDLMAQLRAGADQAIAAGAPQREHTRPVVQVADRPLRDIEDESWALIGAANTLDPRYFLFGDALTDIDSAVDPIRPRLLSLPSLRHHLDRLGDYLVRRGDDDRPVAPPKDVVEMMLSVVPGTLPHLVGVVATPYVAPDGDIVSAPGYCAATGLYQATSDLSMPPVPAAPTAGDMAEARRLLLDELLGDFPFAGQSDRAHALAALLNPIVRPLVSGPTPLMMIEAPIEGSGKGLLAALVAIIATGGPPAVLAEGSNGEEWRKRLTSALVASPVVILLDNIKAKLDSGALSSALTAVTWCDRPMGLSRLVSVPVRCTWMATANNPSYSGEIARRVVRIRLDSGAERPWERTGWRHELPQWALEERPRLLWGLLTLARHWVAAGRPPGREIMGSYETWAAVIGGILGAAGVPGLLGNRVEVYAQAENDLEAWRELVELWWRTYSARPVGIAQLFDLAASRKLLTDLRGDRSDRGARTALGAELARVRGRVIGQWRILDAGVDAHTHVARYALQRLEPPHSPDLPVCGTPGETSCEPPDPPVCEMPSGAVSDQVSGLARSRTQSCAESGETFKGLAQGLAQGLADSAQSYQDPDCETLRDLRPDLMRGENEDHTHPDAGHRGAGDRCLKRPGSRCSLPGVFGVCHFDDADCGFRQEDIYGDPDS